MPVRRYMVSQLGKITVGWHDSVYVDWTERDLVSYGVQEWQSKTSDWDP